MAEEKKLDRNDPLKLVIKLQWASFFLESSIMIDDRMNKKRRKLIGALFDKLCLAAAAFIVNVVRYDGWICCLLRQPIKLQWAWFFLKSSWLMIDSIKKELSSLELYSISSVSSASAYRQHHLMYCWWCSFFLLVVVRLERPIRTYVRNMHIKLFVRTMHLNNFKTAIKENNDCS